MKRRSNGSKLMDDWIENTDFIRVVRQLLSAVTESPLILRPFFTNLNIQ